LTNGSPSEERPIWSRRVEPFWLNPATIKGTVAIAGGLLILATPEASAFVIVLVVGIALIVSGATDVWFHLKGTGIVRGRGIAEGLLSVGVGVVLLVFPNQTLRLIAVIVGGYFVIRGIAVLVAAWRARASGTWAVEALRGLVFVALGGVLIVLPKSVFAGLIVATAAAAIIVGGVMLVYGIQRHSDDEMIDVDAATVSQLMTNWISSQDVGDLRREEIGEGLYFEEPARVPKLVAWWVMLLLSVAIATFAILQDSTAVVIGAMLIAPLMTPILGAAAGIVNAWQWRVVKSLILIVAGVGAAIALAWIIARWVPALVPLDANSQVTSRVNPSLIDMLIALAAGAAGAYANVDKRVSNSIAGVAIAVALVPPLGVVGVTLEAGLLGDSLGAFLLFLTNLVSIILAASVVFLLTGFAPYRKMIEKRSEITAMLRTVVLAALIILVPLSFTAEGILRNAGRQTQAQTIVDEWAEASPNLKVARIEVTGSEVAVLLTGAGEVPSVEDLAASLTDSFGTAASVQVEYAPTVVINYSVEEGRTEIYPTIEE